MHIIAYLDLGICKILPFCQPTNLESIASLPGIVIDTLGISPYFSGPKFTKEGGHVRTGRVLR